MKTYFYNNIYNFNYKEFMKQAKLNSIDVVLAEPLLEGRVRVITKEELSISQKGVLDYIMENTNFKYKSTDTILEEIFSKVSGEQKDRLLNALNKYPVFMAALSTNYGYILAMQTAEAALSAGDIIQDDLDLIREVLYS